jgi:hypothetical protein
VLDDQSDFGGTFTDFNLGNVTGLHKIPGGEGTVIYTAFEAGEIGLLGPTGTTLAKTGTSLTLANFDGAVGGPVSAFALEPDGKVYVVFEGEPGVSPGQVWTANLADPSEAGVLFGQVGDSPRDVVCGEALCFVSNYGDGTISAWHVDDQPFDGPIDTVANVQGTVFLDAYGPSPEAWMASGTSEPGQVQTLHWTETDEWDPTTKPESVLHQADCEQRSEQVRGAPTGALLFPCGYRLGVIY